MKFSQSYKFVDEDEHMAIGYLMLDHSYRLYTDVSANHQPIVYLASYMVQKISQPDNLVMLIRRHRQAIVFFSLFWAMVMVIRFGLQGLLFVMGFEIVKYALLGNEFLAESLAVYPFSYLVGSQLELALTKVWLREDLFLGIVSALTGLTLLPLLPAIGVLLLYRYVVAQVAYWKDGLLGIGLVIVGIFSWINFHDYFRETWINNWLYAMPRLSQMTELYDYLKLWLYPFMSFFDPSGWLNIWIITIALGWLLLFFSSLYLKEKSLTWLIIAFFLFWGLVNARVIKPGVSIYAGFHLLPWLAIGMMGVIFISMTILLPQWRRKYKATVIVFFVTLLLYLSLHTQSPIRAAVDPETENYIQYTPLYQAGQVISSMKNEGDRLMVLPHEALLFWLTQLSPAGRQVTYYEWQFHAPGQQEDYLRVISHEYPEFIQYTDDNSSYKESMERLLSREYRLVFENPNLYVLTTKLDNLTSEQREVIDHLPFATAGEIRRNDSSPLSY